MEVWSREQWNSTVKLWNSTVEQRNSVAKCGGTRADKGWAVKRARPSKKVSCSGLGSN